MDFLWLLAGLALIVKGGELFVAAALRIAEFLKMPRVVALALAHLQRAREARRKGRGQPANRPGVEPRPSTGLVPLCDMSAIRIRGSWPRASDSS